MSLKLRTSWRSSMKHYVEVYMPDGYKFRAEGRAEGDFEYKAVLYSSKPSSGLTALWITADTSEELLSRIKDELGK